MPVSDGIFSGLLSMFGWGVSDFLAAKLSKKIGPIFILFWIKSLFVFISLILYFVLGFQMPALNSVLKSLPVILLAGFSFTIASLSFYKGLAKGNVSIVCSVAASYAFLIVLLSVVFLNEIVKINQIIGIALIILGIPLISLKLEEILKVKKLNIFAGSKEGLIAMLGWGFSFFLIIPASRTIGWFFPAFILNLSVLLFLTGYVFLCKHPFESNFQLPVWILFFSIALSDTLAWFAYGFGVTMNYVTIVAPISASFPLVTIVLARIFLKERLAFNQFLGVAGIITGLILIST